MPQVSGAAMYCELFTARITVERISFVKKFIVIMISERMSGIGNYLFSILVPYLCLCVVVNVSGEKNSFIDCTLHVNEQPLYNVLTVTLTFGICATQGVETFLHSFVRSFVRYNTSHQQLEAVHLTHTQAQGTENIVHYLCHANEYT